MLHEGVRLGPGHPNPSLRILELSLQPGRFFNRYWPLHNIMTWNITKYSWCYDVQTSKSNQWQNLASSNITIIFQHQASVCTQQWSHQLLPGKTATLRLAAMGCRTKPTAGHGKWWIWALQILNYDWLNDTLYNTNSTRASRGRKFQNEAPIAYKTKKECA